MSESKYQPEEGTEDYVHILVSQKQGQPIEPKMELYHPVNVPAVMGLTGFKGEIKHDPRTAAQKKQVAPAIDTVKTDEALDSPESYRRRYEQLFREGAPFNITSEELKVVVDRAEAKLANLVKGIETVEPNEAMSEAERLAQEAAQRDAAAGLPTSKTDWYALFQKTFPDDTTAYDDITVLKIREKLGK